MAPISRRAARGIVIDERAQLVLIRRTRPAEPPYWTAPGGGVEPSDASPVDALQRELREELGATADRYQQVFLFASRLPGGLSVQHFFVCRLTRLDLAARHGPEFEEAGRGAYDVDRVVLDGGGLEGVDLRPAALKEFILANRDALLEIAMSTTTDHHPCP